MDPFTAMAGASVVGGLANYAAGERQVAEQRRARKSFEAAEAARQARIQGIEDPDLQQYDVPLYEDLFNYSPEMLNAIQQEQAELSRYSADPRFRQSQIDALRQLSDLSQGGLTESDRLAMTEAQIGASKADRGRQEAILQALARRGVAGSGQEVAARLASAQQASDQAAADRRAAIQGAQMRGLQALAQQGQLASSIRGQEFGEAAKRASDVDAIRRFNAQNRMGAQAANVDARNRAAVMQYQAKQQISDLNRDVRERQAQQANQLAQQRYNNALSREGLTGPTSSVPATMQTAEAATRARNIGQAVQAGTGAAIFGAVDRPAYASDKDYWAAQYLQTGGRSGPANK